MALTSGQKWAVGGTIAAGALAVGWFIHRRSAQAVTFPEGPSTLLPGSSNFHTVHARHERRKKFLQPGDRNEFLRENERGEYGRRHHRRHKHG